MTKLDILYEDNHIIVVFKPAGILSQADKSGDVDMITIIKSYLKEKYNKPGNVYLGLVHRLDRPVSGIMVFAKTSKAASRLSEEIRNKLLTELKKYEYTPVNNPEISVIRTYLDTLINLPFNKSSEEESNLKKISEYLRKNLNSTTVLGPGMASILKINNLYNFEVILKLL